MSAAEPPPAPVVIDGIPVIAPPAAWRWALTPIPGASGPDGSKVYLLRLFTAAGLIELWAEEPFFRELIDAWTTQFSGLQIVPANGVRDIRPRT